MSDSISAIRSYFGPGIPDSSDFGLIILAIPNQAWQESDFGNCPNFGWGPNQESDFGDSPKWFQWWAAECNLRIG
jgi:hypothetical protein